MFHRLVNAIEQIPAYEIANVRSFQMASHEERISFDPISMQSMMIGGLAISLSARGGMAYKPTEVCEAFVRL